MNIKTNEDSSLYKHYKYTDIKFIKLCHVLAKKTKKYSGAEIVNICREASICALRQTLKKRNIKINPKIKIKIKNNETNNTQNNIAHSEKNKYPFDKEPLIGLSKKHFLRVLKKIKPQTSESLINFYKNYKEQNKV